ncbi:MAG: hypothetical protein HQL16_01680 [Candidatus Omnitrophica bacterium]|nr:hypothetical protein [Candidatus Omnitrophota bacterium]
MPVRTKREQDFIDRREGIRAARVIAVKHRLIKRGAQKAASEWSLSTTRNMSVSGLLFNSPVSYHKDDVIELEVVMSGMIDIFNGAAVVVRSSEISAHSFDIAARYITEKPKLRSAKTHIKKKSKKR